MQLLHQNYYHKQWNIVLYIENNITTILFIVTTDQQSYNAQSE